MNSPQFSRRELLQQSALAGGGLLLLAACRGGSSPQSNVAAANGSARLGTQLPPIEGATVVTDPAKIPAKFAESPRLAALVQAGKLPPVAQRIGQDPLVIKPVHEIGKYGGQIRRAYIGAADHLNAVRFCAGPDSLFYWDYLGKAVVPNLARAYEFNADHTVMTLHLRRGMRWSDGQPFTADDIVFWREDINLNPNLGSPVSTLQLSGKPVQVRKVDDYTVEYVSPEPYPALPRFFASDDDSNGMVEFLKLGGGGYAPKHYLSQFLPKYTSEAAANRAAKAAGFDGWAAQVQHVSDWTLNRSLPTLTPWIMTHPINQSPWEFEANPYSIWVDTDGNQLPYIDKVTMTDAKNLEVISLQATAGQYDFQDRNLQLASFPVLVKNQSRSGYTIHRAPSTTIDLLLKPNLAYMKDKTLGDLIRTTDFRRALSLAIDRNKINQTFFLGTCVPTANVPADDNPYFPGAQWRTKWATLDVAQANKLLDGIGLTKKDGSGYRMRPDGKGHITLQVIANKSFADFPSVCDMIKTGWQAIGIDLIVQTVDPGFMISQILANEAMIQALSGGTEEVFVFPDSVIPVVGVSGIMGIPYAKWLSSGGKSGMEPPSSVSGLKDAWNLYQQGSTLTDSQRIPLGKKIFMMHADQVWSIGIVGFGLTQYGLYYAKNNLGNVPKRMVNSTLMRTPSNGYPMTFYYKS